MALYAPGVNTMTTRKGESLPTVNMLALLLAKLDCITNARHVLTKSVAGYTVTRDLSTNVLGHCPTLAQLYVRVEEYYYSVMYSHIGV
jgi:hypothetical protein